MKQPLEIATKLVEQYEDINYEIDNINRGGCGIFAEHLYKALLRLNVEPNIVVISPLASEMEKRINGEKHEPYFAGIYHIMIEVEGRLIDSHGIHDSINHTEYSHLEMTKNLSLAKLIEWNEDYTIWNRRFDRDNIINIESKLEKCYNYLTKSLEIPN